MVADGVMEEDVEGGSVGVDVDGAVVQWACSSEGWPKRCSGCPVEENAVEPGTCWGGPCKNA